MCDAAYALLVERITQQVLAERQVIAVYRAAGAKGVDMPTVDAAVAALDAALLEEPKAVRREDRVLREALGLPRAG